MNSEKYIKLILEVTGNKLSIKIECSQNIKKYFLTDYAYVEYDQDMTNIDKSILYIPIVSTIITMAWAIGADVYVETLDKNFMESLSKIKQVFQQWYPEFSFSTNLYVEKVIPNQFNGEGIGILFTGGVDALTSYLRQKDKNPDLFMAWDMNLPVTEFGSKGSKDHWKNLHLIKSNMKHLFDQKLLRNEFNIGNWNGSINLSLRLLGLCAPLTTKGIGTVLIAASFSDNDRFVEHYGSHPLIDNNVAWANVKVNHDGYELSRQDKIEYIAKYPEYLSDLRVCNNHKDHKNYNCCRCEKCSRTIIGLILAGIDPGKYNFNIDNKKILGYVKDCWVKGIFEGGKHLIFWSNMQKHIPEQFNNDIYGSKEFFTWFGQFDFSNYRMNKLQHSIWGYRGIFNYVSEEGVMTSTKKTAHLIVRRLKGM